MKHLIKTKYRFLLPLIILPEYFSEWLRYVRHSGVVFRSDEQKLRARIIAQYHILEKGLTMPESRTGFGQPQAVELAVLCEQYTGQFGTDECQIRHAVGVLKEYCHFQEERGFALDGETVRKVDQLAALFQEATGEQVITTPGEYFALTEEPFPRFAKSRCSVRNYSSEPVDAEKIKAAVEVAKKSPSSCNRQGTKVHLEMRKEVLSRILEIQSGNRGFGHLAQAAIVVKGDIRACFNVYENHMPYVDGGMFAMSLLYALHHEHLVACPLNCYLSKAKLGEIARLCEFEESEVPIVMIAVGVAPDSFKIASSPRLDESQIITVKQ